MAKEYHKNPRKITPELMAQLEANLKELGDLSGITHDLNTDEIITGNQRSKAINLDECEIEILEQFKKPDAQGTVARGFVNWDGQKLNYRQVRWDDDQREKANITANSITGIWDEEVLRTMWDNVKGLEEWNLPFVLDIPPLLMNDIEGIAKTSNKYHDTKPLIFISFNLVQKQILVAEEEAKQFLNGIIDFTRDGDALQDFFNEVYRLSFDLMQQKLNK